MNDINQLRAALFAELESVQAGTSDTERTRQVVSTAQVLVNLAKVEVDYYKATGGGASRFIEPQKITPPPTVSIRRVEGKAADEIGREPTAHDPWSMARSAS